MSTVMNDLERDLEPPTADQVEAVVETLRRWRYVDPEHRAALRGAVAALPLVEYVAPRPLGPIDPPLRVKDVAQILRVSEGTVRNLVRSGVLYGYSLSGRKGSEWRIPESSVVAYLERTQAPVRAAQ